MKFPIPSIMYKEHQLHFFSFSNLTSLFWVGGASLFWLDGTLSWEDAVAVAVVFDDDDAGVPLVQAVLDWGLWSLPCRIWRGQLSNGHYWPTVQ